MKTPDFARLDLATCAVINRVNRYRLVSALFGSASELGNGLFWYCLMLALLLTDGVGAVPAVTVMALVGIAGTVLYKLLKRATARPRPCAVDHSLIRTIEPLDRFSFPSGHTLHAVSFTIIACVAYPALSWYLIPFTVIVALSRMVLGLHYPSDVVAGASLGALLAGIGLELSAIVHFMP